MQSYTTVHSSITARRTVRPIDLFLLCYTLKFLSCLFRLQLIVAATTRQTSNSLFRH